MSLSARLSLVGVALAGAFFLAAFAFIPTRVSFGAGSVRCGTSLHPERDSEISRLARVCPEVGHQRLLEAGAVTALFAAIGLVPLALRQSIENHRPVRRFVMVALLVFWVFGTPLAVYFITGAHSAD
jgi:hypothetical protein